MKKQFIAKGQNAKGLWVVEVYDTNKQYADGGNVLLETRSFTTKSSMQKWLKLEGK